MSDADEARAACLTHPFEARSGRITRVLAGGDADPKSVLRPMTHADLDDLIAVQAEGARLGLANIFPQDQYPFPVATVRARWIQELADPAIDCFVVLDATGSIAGFAAVHDDEFLHFGTAVKTWGGGLAGRAHDAVVCHWTGRGYVHAWLRVFEANTRGRRFYERRGWRSTGERSESTFAPFPVLVTYELDFPPGVGA